jgi:SAM-dependent methyltransferase
MEPLKRHEYAAAYYGDDPAGSHPAGYSPAYGRVVCPEGGEDFATLAAHLHQTVDVRGKLVLELGCAMGYLVADLRGLGANAIGIDWSPYAIHTRPDPGAVGHLHVENVWDYLDPALSPHYDLLVSRCFLECFRSSDIPPLVRLMNRAADRQIHTLTRHPNPQWYLNHRLDWWASQGFAPGTRLLSWTRHQITQDVEVT